MEKVRQRKLQGEGVIRAESGKQDRTELGKGGKVFSDSLQEEKAQQPEDGWCGGKRPEVAMEK